MNDILEYKGYWTRVKYSAEDKILYGTIEGISDLVNFECDNSAEVEAAFHEAVDDYLAFCADIGQEPDRAYRGTFNVRINPELHRRVDQAAYKAGISMNQMVERALSVYMDSLDRKPSAPIYTQSESKGIQEVNRQYWKGRQSKKPPFFHVAALMMGG